MERVYAGHLCYGPPIEEGFYYDMYTDEYRVSYFKAVTHYPSAPGVKWQQCESNDILHMYISCRFQMLISRPLTT